jgi:phage portal protein BeeE
MAAKDLTVEQAYDLLASWTKTLARNVESSKDEVLRNLKPTTLQLDAPTNAAAALLALSGIRQALSEVGAAVGYLQRAIRKEGAA